MILGGALGSRTLGAGTSQEIPTELIVSVGSDARASRLYVPGSLRVNAELGGRSTADAAYADHAGTLAVEPGSPFVVTKRGATIFRGSVERVSEDFPTAHLGGTFRRVSVTAVDFSQIADRRLVSRIFDVDGQTTGDIVRLLVSDYLSADLVTDDFVEDGLEVGRVVFNASTVSAALSSLAELVGYEWWIDHARRLHYRPHGSLEAPFPIRSDTAYRCRAIRIERSRERYRNAQTLRAGRAIGAERSRSFQGDNSTQVFDVEFPIAEKPTILVGATPQTVGIQGIDDEVDNPTHQWFWQRGSRTVSQRDDDTPVGTIQALTVQYRPLLPIVVTSQDDDEVRARAAVEGGSGVYEALETDSRIESESLALDTVISLLRRHGRIPKTLRVETDEFGIAPGQLQDVALSTEGVAATYLVERVGYQDIGDQDGTLRASYEAIDGESLGGWPEFFLRLAEAGRDFDLDGDEQLIVSSGSRGTVELDDDASSSASGSSLSAWESDPASVFLVGSSPVGAKYTAGDGSVTYHGPLIAEVTSP